MSERDNALAQNTGQIIASLYTEYQDTLFGFALSLSHDEERSKDLVQETFTRALANISLLTELNSYQRKAWLYRVLKNRFIDEHRGHQRKLTILKQLSRTIVTEAPIVGWQFSDLLCEVPEQYRDLLNKRYVLGMNSTEIGREFGVPPATVRSRLRLAINWIREHQTVSV